MKTKEVQPVAYIKPEPNSPRILCFVLTHPGNLRTKTIEVRNTWSKRCDKTLFISDVDDKIFPTIAPKGIRTGYAGLWSKTLLTFRMIYRRYLRRYDWFLKADDNTYIVVENLRKFLAKYDPDMPHFFGKYFKAKGGYNSGGAGYVLSRESVRLFEEVVSSFNQPKGCDNKHSTRAEDWVTAQCLKAAGVRPGRAMDSKGFDLFHCFNPETECRRGARFPMWYEAFTNNTIGMGCSNETISFHYVSPERMILLEDEIYRKGRFLQN